MYPEEKELKLYSTDEKPTRGLATGSLCIEVDTGTVYLFGAKTSEWFEWFTPGDSAAKSVSLTKSAAPEDTKEDEPEER